MRIPRLKFKKKNLKIKPVPLTKLLPNIMTLLGLIVGVSSIRFGFEGYWEQALYCIIAASIIDGLDGRMARFLNATSHFGAELDSLCDFVNFGVCPAVLLYMWSYPTQQYKLIAWFSVLFFIICMCIRLARFNTALVQTPDKKVDKRFFLGVPAPSGALLVLMPIILDLDIMPGFYSIELKSYSSFVYCYIIFVAFLLPSRLPTPSFKKAHIAPEHLALTMIAIATFITMLLMYPWYLLPILGVIYLVSIPYCIYIAYNSHDVVEDVMRASMNSNVINGNIAVNSDNKSDI